MAELTANSTGEAAAGDMLTRRYKEAGVGTGGRGAQRQERGGGQ